MSTCGRHLPNGSGIELTMGSKETTQETRIPEATPEEREQQAQLNALIDAQLSGQYDKTETTRFVYNKQGEIDEINRQIDSVDRELQALRSSQPYGYNTPQYQQLAAQKQRYINQREQFMMEGGREQIDIQYTEKPEVKARRLRREAASDKVEAAFFAAAEKLAKGDLSVTPEQRKQIDELIGDNFSSVIDELKVQFSSAEDAVNEAVNKLVESGKADIAQAAIQNRNQLKRESESLGRSFADSSFQDRQTQFEQGALESLYRGASAESAAQIASLRGQRALSIGGVKENEGLARFNLLQQAATPLTAFGAGAQFAQLQGALNAQNQQNLLGIGGLANANLQRYLGERTAQPTTTVSQPWGVLDVLGALAGAGGAAASGIAAFK